MTIRLSAPEYHALKQMQQGMYLMRSDLAEGMSYGAGITSMVKKGTIEELESFGLIVESINPGKWLLTDEGRHYV